MTLKPLILLSLFIATEALSQKPIPLPRDSVRITMNGKKIAVEYGKPAMQGRKIFGGVVPYFKIWRTGGGKATTLSTDVDLEVDGAIIPRGKYSLYTLPSESRWKLIINKQTGQWGTMYNPSLDLARIDLAVKKLKSPSEFLTFKIVKNDNGSGIFKIEWETTSLSVPFHISMDTLVPSPRDSAALVLNGKKITVDYGRPSMRGRKIMGGVVPYNKVWRTGANAATGFTTQADLLMGNTVIPRGTYTLYTLPSAKQWKLILNKQTGQWGTVYNEKLDLVRIPLKKKTQTPSVEKFSIQLKQISDTSGEMILAWEKTELSIRFQIK